MAIDQVLQNFDRYSQEEHGEGSQGFLAAGPRQREEHEGRSREGHPMDLPVVRNDDTGPNRLEGTENQEGYPDAGDGAE
jgi:hypothetical protein